MSSFVTDICVLGDMARASEGNLEGWCWSPDSPRERLIVEVLVDGAFAAATTAARMNTDLRDRGIGDGYHWFSLPMPPAGEGAAVIEARERRSGYVFGRVVLSHGAAATARESRLTALSQTVAAAEIELLQIDRSPPPKALRDHMRQLGLLLRRIGRTGPLPSLDGQSIALALCHQYASSTRPFDLPLFRSPDFSIIVLAEKTWDASVAAIRAVGPTLEGIRAELIVVDDGACPMNVLLGTRIGQLNYLRLSDSVGVAERMNVGASVARGRRLLFAASLSRLSALAPIQSVALTQWPLIVGEGASAVAQSLCVDSTISATITTAAADALDLGVDRPLFDALGGFDEATQGDGQLASVDFMLKARLLGADSVSLRMPGARPGAPVDEADPCVIAFQQRWCEIDSFARDIGA